MEVDKATVGRKIKEVRISLGLTMEGFGKRFDTSKGTVNNWEKGRNLPNKNNLKVIAELGGISVGELLKNTNPLEEYSDIELLNELLRRKQNS